jgi:hypothetical protein
MSQGNNVGSENQMQSRDVDASVDEPSASAVKQSLEKGDVGLLWPYLQSQLAPLLSANGHDDAARLVRVLAGQADPQGTTEFKLRLGRRRRGRPSRPRTPCRNAEIVQDIESSRARGGGKLEAALNDVGERRKLSRSTLLAIRKMHKCQNS